MLMQRIPTIIATKESRWVKLLSSLHPLPRHTPAEPTSPASDTSPTNPSANIPTPIHSIIYDYNVRLSYLGRCKTRVKDARKLFDEMPQRDSFSYATMISIYLRSHDLPSAENLFMNVPEGARGVAAATAMIGGYSGAGRLEDARNVFDEMPDRNVYSWTCMMSGYFANGQVEEGARVFDQMPVKNVVSWTNVVQGYARNGLIDKARAEFDRMPERNVVSWTVMMEGYIGIGRIDEAMKLFDESPYRNLYTWNVIISGLLANGRVDEAIRLFGSMPSRSVISWTVMITGLAENQLIELSRVYFDRMPDKDRPAWNAMITAYTHEGVMVEAEKLFNLMPEKDVVTWNAMIEGYARHGKRHEAFEHYNLMLRAFGFRPNCDTMASLMTSCQRMLEFAASHSLVIKLGFGRYTVLANALITAYSRAGDISSACVAFEALKCKDIVSWGAIMIAYSDHGYGKHMLQAFAKMLRSGPKPDGITFVALLLGCCRVGLVEKAKSIFDSMPAFGLEPNRQHYTCIVDGLARAGRLEGAMEFIREMPQNELDEVVVGALLSACRLRGDVEATRLVSKELIDHIETDSSAGFTLIANTFAASERWDEVAQVRKAMKAKEIKKTRGVSWIDVRGGTHVFFSGDRSRRELEEVHRCLIEDLQPSVILLNEDEELAWS